MQKHWLYGTGVAVLSFLVTASVAYAALTFEATTITSDGVLTLTTAVGSNTAVTRGLTANSATTTDSFSTGGLTTLTGATASATALVIGTDTQIFRSAANLLTLQGGLSMTSATASGTSLVIGNDVRFFRSGENLLTLTGGLTMTGATASGTSLVIGTDVPLFRNAANQLRLQGILSVRDGGTFNAATTTDSFSAGGLTTLTGATASATALVIGTDVPVFRNAANTLTIQGTLALSNGETIANTTNNNIFINAQGVSAATSSATTTRQFFLGAPAGITTTTLAIGGRKGSRGACLELWQENVAYRVYVIASPTIETISGFTLGVQAGSCRD